MYTEAIGCFNIIKSSTIFPVLNGLFTAPVFRKHVYHICSNIFIPGLLQRETGLTAPVIITDHSKAMLLLWFIVIANVRPLSIFLWLTFNLLEWYCGHLLWKSCPLGFSLVLFLF